MKPFTQGTVNFFYHTRNAFQLYTDLDGLLDLAKCAKLFVCRMDKRHGAYFYEPVSEPSLREQWCQVCALGTNETLDKLDLLWTASHLTSIVGAAPDNQTALAGIITPWWGYTDRSFRHIWFYLNIGLNWGEKPLSPAALKLLETIERR